MEQGQQKIRSMCAVGLIVYFIYLGAVTLAPFDFQEFSQMHPWERAISLSASDVILNIILFLPLGGLLYGIFKEGSNGRRLRAVLFIAAMTSLSIEIAQLFLPERYSSFSDLLTNSLGGGIGFFLVCRGVSRGWARRLWNHHRKFAKTALLLYMGLLLLLAGSSLERLNQWGSGASLWVGIDPAAEDGWEGTFYFLAVYAEAFDPARVQNHYQAGVASEREVSLRDAPLVLYTFDEQEGNLVHDHALKMPPLDLQRLGDKGRWLTPSGYVFDGSTGFRSLAPAEKVMKSLAAGHRFTLEAWIDAKRFDYDQAGHLISLIRGTNKEYFMLQQAATEITFEVRNRTKRGWLDGGKLETFRLRLPRPMNPAHVMAVYDFGRTFVYVNGTLAAEAILTDGLFLLTDRLAFRTTRPGECAFLGGLLFWPIGFLAGISYYPRSKRASALVVFSLWIFVFAVHLLEGRHPPTLFTGGFIAIPFGIVLIGVLMGRMTEIQLPKTM
ncbi:MAG: VanZ family protein [Nitrospirae bacterium]|nr:VanZ family protein [Candidatus Manganitrophaceae bacterium]